MNIDDVPAFIQSILLSHHEDSDEQTSIISITDDVVDIIDVVDVCSSLLSDDEKVVLNVSSSSSSSYPTPPSSAPNSAIRPRSPSPHHDAYPSPHHDAYHSPHPDAYASSVTPRKSGKINTLKHTFNDCKKKNDLDDYSKLKDDYNKLRENNKQLKDEYTQLYENNMILNKKVEELELKLKKYTNGDNHKRYYEKNKEKIKKDGLTYLTNLKIENPEKIKEYNRTAYLNKKKKKEQNAVLLIAGVDTGGTNDDSGV